MKAADFSCNFFIGLLLTTIMSDGQQRGLGWWVTLLLKAPRIQIILR